MKNLLHSKKIFPAFVALAAAALLAACGGGGDSSDATSEPAVDPVAETERKQALGLFDKLPVSWAPSKIETRVGLGVRQDLQVTFTTTKALKNARIVFVPDLRNAVTVSPGVIPALAAGQSATVTLTFAPKTTDTRKLIAGVVLLVDRNATISQPLPVKVSLVKPANWPEVPQGQSIGVTFRNPPNWSSIYIEREGLVSIQNFSNPGPLSEEKFKNEAHFQVFRQAEINPEELPIDAWFLDFLEPGVPTEITQKSLITVGGRPAVRIVVSEMGGDRVHIYIADGTDVIEVAYGLYEPSFIPAYESILAGLTVTNQ